MSGARRCMRVSCVTMLACAIDVLSIGPAVGLYGYVPPSLQAVMETVYRPVITAANHSPLEGPLIRYTQWWR